MKPIDQVKKWMDEGKVTITPAELASVIGGTAYSYNIAAKAGRLGLPHVFAGRCLKIFTAGVYKAMIGSQEVFL